jgi:hypothetical protein
MHFTHIRRRILKIRPSVRKLDLEEEEEEPDKPVILIVDASGLAVSHKKNEKEQSNLWLEVYALVMITGIYGCMVDIIIRIYQIEFNCKDK